MENQRQARAESTQRAAAVNQNVVEGQTPRPPRIWDQTGQHGLFQGIGRGALRTGAVEHADEDHHEQQGERR